MKDKVFRQYRRLLLKLQLPYFFWLIIVLGVFYFSKSEVKDPAYFVLGRSVLFFLPVPFVAWIILFQKWWKSKSYGSSVNYDQTPFVEANLKKLSSTLQFFQLLFILLLMATLVITLMLKTGFAIVMISLTIQWFILTVIHFTEYYYATNTLRELKRDE